MAYIGKAPVNGFHTKQSLTGDGSTTSFALSYTVADPSSLIVSVGGVLQEPGVAYTLSGGGTNIVFTGAPSSTDTVYVHFLGTAIVQNLLDINGAEFILDANANTSFTADTDDEIDIKVGGTDRSTIKATGFHNVDSVKFVAGTGDDLQLYHDGTNSYLTNATGALKVATETSGIAITLGHTTSEVTIADNATVAGNLTVTGTLTQTGTQTFDGGIDVDNFNINGTTIALSSGDMTLDSAGDIILDADGADLVFADNGTNLLKITNSSSDVVFQPQVNAKDIKFNQYDGRTLLDINDGGWVGIANGATGPGQLRLYEDTDLGTNYSAFQVGTQSGDITYTLPTADASSSGYALTSNASGTLSWSAVSANTPTSADGQALGSASLEWSDLFLADGAVINFGADQDVSLTHVADTGLLLSSTDKLQFNDASQFIHGSSATVLSIGATDEIDLTATAIDINGTCDVSGAFTAGSTIVATSTIQGTTITATTAFVPDASGGADLGTTALEFNDAFFNDAAVINFGYDQDVTLTHVADTGLLLNSTMKIQFNDASQFIHGSSNAILSLGATDEIDLTATAIDINGTCDVSGAFTTGSTIVATGVVTAAGFTIGSAVIGEAELEILDGATVTTTELNLIDGDTARGTTAVVAADGFLVNDNGTMRMTSASTVQTYMSGSSATKGFAIAAAIVFG